MQDSKRDTDVKNRLLDFVGEGEAGMIWENTIETRMLPYVKQIARSGSMQEAAGLVPWEDPEGWDGEGGGWRARDRGTLVHPWLIHANVWQKPLQYCKIITLQSK